MTTDTKAPSLRKALERIIQIYERNAGRQNEKLADIPLVARRALDTPATPPAPTPSAARERIARAAKVAHFGANTGQIIKPEAVPFAGYMDRDWLAVADAILALLPDVAAIRAAAFEEAAKIADGEYSDQNWHAMYRHAAGTIAAAIRAAGEK